jgi:hypothetical protein
MAGSSTEAEHATNHSSAISSLSIRIDSVFKVNAFDDRSNPNETAPPMHHAIIARSILIRYSQRIINCNVFKPQCFIQMNISDSLAYRFPEVSWKGAASNVIGLKLEELRQD